VSLVVLHSPALPVQPERMHEVDGDLLSGEHVGGPVKAVGRLEGDLDITAMGGHRIHELERAAVDAHAAEQLALVVLVATTERRRCKSIPT